MNVERRRTFASLAIAGGALFALSSVWFFNTKSLTEQTKSMPEQIRAEQIQRITEVEISLANRSQPVSSRQSAFNSQDAVAPAEPSIADKSQGLSSEVGQLLVIASAEKDALALHEALTIHDNCVGIPRTDAGYNAWLERHAGEPGFDFDYARTLRQTCKDVPMVPFQRRVELILPLASSGDPLAQYLLGASYPSGSQTRGRWLTKASIAGDAAAMMMLAQDFAAYATSSSERIKAWALYAYANEDSESDAQDLQEHLEASMTLEDIQSAKLEHRSSTLEDILKPVVEF